MTFVEYTQTNKTPLAIRANGVFVLSRVKAILRLVRLGGSKGEELLDAWQDVRRVGVQPFLDEGAVVQLLDAQVDERVVRVVFHQVGQVSHQRVAAVHL